MNSFKRLSEGFAENLRIVYGYRVFIGKQASALTQKPVSVRLLIDQFCDDLSRIQHA